MYSYTIRHIDKNLRIRPQEKLDWQFITIHNTANPRSSANNERDWLENPSNKRDASWHIAIDQEGAVEAIPLDEVAWHAGYKGNHSSLGIEICESGDYDKTMRNAVKLVAKLLHSKNKQISDLKQHYDWTGKNCPNLIRRGYLGWTWNKFKEEIYFEMKSLNSQEPHSWATNAWEWATEEGYLDGTRPRDALTREEFSIILQKIVNRGD